MNTEHLKAIEKIYAGYFDGINPITNARGVSGLLKYIISYIENMPELSTDSKIAIREDLEYIGQIMTKHIINDNTYTAYMTKIRNALKKKYGPAIVPIMTFANISDSIRTALKNQAQQTRRDGRHYDAFNISTAEIAELIKKMTDDINGGSWKYRDVILLMFELCTGARLGEIATYSKFSQTGENEITQTGILKTGRQDNEQSQGNRQEEQKQKLKIPTLAPAGFLIDNLNKWRENNEIKEGTYDEDEMRKIIMRATYLLRKRYLTNGINADKKPTSHLLRGIYANLAFKQFGKKNETPSAFISRVLGHSGLNTGLNYSYIKITD